MAEQYGTDSMPETAENVATAYGISRADQDAFALRSQERTAKADRLGPAGPGDRAGPGPAATRPVGAGRPGRAPARDLAEALAALAPIAPGGTVTAGNASGVNDGAAAVLVASEPAVRRYGLTPLARVTSGAAAGVPPRVMGIGPVPPPASCSTATGWTVGDLDVVELNEAFAAQALAVLRQLGLPDDAEHVNPNGGAIALGHPLGASGARLA